jgi:hypothetical protein
MKQKIKIAIGIVIVIIAIQLSSFQTKAIDVPGYAYTYDASGNRLTRTYQVELIKTILRITRFFNFSII